MQEIRRLKIDPRVIIYGSQEQAAALMRMLPKEQPVIWVNEERHDIGESFPDEAKLGYKITCIEGSAGNFRVKLEGEHGSQWVKAGVVVLFPGVKYREKIPSVTGKRVLALLSGLRRGAFSRALDVVMMMARENEIFVVTDSVQVSYPGGEEKFTQARRLGVVFFRSSNYYIENRDEGGYHLVLPAHEPEGLGTGIVLDIDYIWQADSLDSSVEEWRISFKLGDRTASGILSTRREGIFLFPGPADVTPEEEQELMAAVAARISAYFRGNILISEEYRIEPERCSLCLTCFRICPHVAIEIKKSPDPDYADMYGAACKINPLACTACGACYVACPAQAVTSIGGEEKERKAAVLACENSGGPLLERWGKSDNCRLYSCASAITVTEIVETMLGGADKVLIMACRHDGCRHGHGDVYCEKRLRRLNGLLAELGLGKRVEILRVAPADYVKEG